MKRAIIDEVSTIGAGRVGVTCACWFASKGVKVHLYEKDIAKRRLLSQGQLPFYELGLERLWREAVDGLSIRLVESTREAVTNSDITFVAVGTPSQPSGRIDLSQIRKASAEIGKAIAMKSGYHIVVVQSTVVPGTTMNVIKPILEKFSSKEAGRDFGLVTQPEFLREGSAMHDLKRPSRIVVGAFEHRSEATLVSLLRQLHGRPFPPFVQTTPTTAEMIKYASNAFLATKLSFINEIAELCERAGSVDVVEVAKGVGLDPRIRQDYLGAGIGFGGSCIPKDLAAFISHSRSVGVKPKILEAVQAVNKRQPYRVVNLARKQLGKMKYRKAAVLGLTFKPETDDSRASPALTVVRALLREGCKVTVFDPKGLDGARKLLGAKVIFARDALECVKGADCCFICTPWKEFASLDLNKLARRMRSPLIVDGRRLYDPGLIPKGVMYEALGLGGR